MSSTSMKRLAGWILISIPPLSFYAILLKSLSRLPFFDDYAFVFSFLLQWKTEHGLQHLEEIVASRTDVYRLIFGHAIYGAQFAMLGHTDLRSLALLGDLFVLPILGILYFIWRSSSAARDSTPLAFVPVSCLLFQLQYASALNSAFSPMQYFPAILFALSSIYLGTKQGPACFAGSVTCMILAIASSGNGFFLIPVGCVMFLQRKEPMRLAVWLSLGCFMGLMFFLQGHSYHVANGDSTSLLTRLEHFSPSFAAAFLGSIGAAANPVPAICLGALLVGIFVVATVDRLFETDPALYYSIPFFLITALAVSCLRSDYGSGLVTALGSRYRIYSTVLVALTYMYLAGRYKRLKLSGMTSWIAPCILAITLPGFDAVSDWQGNKILQTRRAKVEAAIMRWQRHEARPSVTSSFANDYTAENEKKGIYEPVEPIFSDAIQAGIYQLPQLPERR